MIIVIPDIINHQYKLTAIINGKIYEELIDFKYYSDDRLSEFKRKIRNIKIDSILFGYKNKQ